MTVLTNRRNRSMTVPDTDELNSGPRGGRLWSLLAPSSHIPTYVGLALAAVGFGLIAFSWGKVAALTNVALQMPYFVSGGLTGIGLVMVGLVVVNISAKRQDAAERARQMEQLTEVLDDLRQSLRELDDQP